MEAADSYRSLLEFYLKTRAAVDAKYSELIGFGYQSYRAPYETSFGMYFAMVKDPDGNTILLSGDLEENETSKEGQQIYPAVCAGPAHLLHCAQACGLRD